MKIIKEGKVEFSKEDLEWLDHWITEADNFMSKAKKDFIVTDDFSEACDFLDSK